MEPALDERGDRHTPASTRTRPRAAMEPALDERGDLDLTELYRSGRGAAMEPALDERGDSSTAVRNGIQDKPQWSPLSTSGATRARGWSRRIGSCRNGARSRRAGRLGHPADALADRVAAMEPALDERGDRPSATQPRAGADAAMEPALDERGDLHTLLLQLATFLPQWSPLSTSGATPASVQMRTIPTRAAMEPALDERGDRRRAGLPGLARQAAMEPALDERGDVAHLTARQASGTEPQWSPLSTSGATPASASASAIRSWGRNGARSRRAGRPHRRSTGGRGSGSRNGARSRRAGRP